ncbi:MAG TPA: dienelactone hydrolase family protein [Sphingobacteriaceae bacterium]|nr:dienelactone hydrolase family protein [Sphingobacteriaceae bacterium]
MAHAYDLKVGGKALDHAEKALIMIHGRGGTAADIMGLSSSLKADDFAILAPQATHHTWYPLSFLAPVAQNQPWLGSALEVIGQTVQTAIDHGIKPENIYFFGFSQGACLSLEFLARNAKRYGGAVAIIGGVIGREINRNNYHGNFQQTPILLATSNPDFHVPLERVQETAGIFAEMNADVTTKVFENAGHTIKQAHIDLANELVF